MEQVERALVVDVVNLRDVHKAGAPGLSSHPLGRAGTGRSNGQISGGLQTGIQDS